MWSIEEQVLLATYELQDFTQSIASFDFNLESGWLAYSTDGDTIYLVKTDDWTTRTITKADMQVHRVHFLPNSQVLASTDNRVHFWDIETLEQINVFSGFYGITAIAFNPQGDELLIAGNWAKDGQQKHLVRVLDYENRELVVPDIQVGIAENVIHHPTEEQLAILDGSNIYIWDTNINKRLAILTAPTDITAYTYSFTGQIIVSNDNGRTFLWENATTDSQILLETNEPIYNLAAHPQGNILAYSTNDTIHLFNLTTQTHLSQLTGHTRFVNQLQFSEDGSLLISSSNDGTIIIWAIQ